MQIKVWKNFSKRYNSTKLPTGGTTVTVYLKDGTSIDNPTFILHEPDFEINYINAFNKYYFVDDIKSIHNNLIEITCHIDVLATYRSDISNVSLYIVRCSDSSKADYSIIDATYPISMVPLICTTKEITPDIFNSKTVGTGVKKPETVILTIKGSHGSQFVAMEFGNLAELGRALYNTAFNDQSSVWSQVGNIPSGFEKTFLDPFSYICEARLLPTQYFELLSTNPSYAIYLGYWEYDDPDQTNIFSYLPDRKIYADYVNITPDPVLFDSKLWLASNKFRKLFLTLPGVGTVQLDADKVLDSNISVFITVDVVGCVAYRVEYNGFTDFYTGKIGCNLAIHYSNANVGYMTGSATNVIGDIIGGAGTGAGIGAGAGSLIPGAGTAAGAAIGAIGGAIGGVIKGIASGLSNAQPLVITRSNGADGSLADFLQNNKVILQDVRYDIGGMLAPGQNGYPASTVTLLSTIANGSYVQCENASVSISGTDKEKVELNNLLNSGFYWE